MNITITVKETLTRLERGIAITGNPDFSFKAKRRKTQSDKFAYDLYICAYGVENLLVTDCEDAIWATILVNHEYIAEEIKQYCDNHPIGNPQNYPRI